MTNAELFKKVFGIYAGELWSFNAEKMQAWLASDAPDAVVVEKERYNRLRENANIMADALSEYQSADMVEVVRCEKCFYGKPYNERWTLPKKNNCIWCRRYEDARTPDWFCADGERREDNA